MFYGPMHWTRRDGIAHAIQRGRDLGVPPLNTVLEHYNVATVLTDSETTSGALTWDDWAKKLDVENDNLGADKLKQLKVLYNNDPNKVELFVGG